MADAIDLDAVLAELKTGRFQLRNFGLILLPVAFSAIYNAQYIFNAAVIPHRCLVPECESPPAAWEPGEWGAWALPAGASCQRYQPATPGGGGACAADAFTNHTEACADHVYENRDSIAYTFDLACQDWQLALVGTVHSLGLLAALPTTGYVSDTFGRRITLILTAVSAGALGVARAFMPTYALYLLFEFLEPTFGSGVYSTGFILALEMVEVDKRVLGGNLISCTFALGQVALGLLAWAVPRWRALTLLIYAPSLLFVFYYFWLTESVRWLLTKGRRKEAVAIIYKAAAVNRRKLSPQTIKLLDAPPAADQASADQPQRTPSVVLQVVRSRVLMSRLCICSFWWITTTLIYYGLSINSVSLAGNPYGNYVLTALVEIPGYALSVLTLDRFGRKRSIITAFAVCGVTLLSIPFIPLQWAVTSATLLGKLAISMVFTSIYIYTMELFPTQCRHQMMGFCSTIGRIGSIVAPFTPLLMAYMEALPYLVFGSMSGLAALLMLLAPETLRTVLPDTVAQAEGLARRPPAPAAARPKASPGPGSPPLDPTV